jgi:hypothetical protein
MQLTAFNPEHVVIHEVPKHRRGETGTGPDLSDLVDALDGDLQDYFRTKIIDTLVEKGHRVVAAQATESLVPDALAKALTGNDNFLACSRDLAIALYNTQSGNNNAGLLVALSGKIDVTPALAILKLERLQGVRAVRETTDSGQRHFNLSHLRDLMLNERTRVFKAGVFVLGTDGRPEGVVSDEQRGSKQEEVATFFLDRFLGFELRVSAKAATKAFYYAAVDWINARVDDPDDKTKYLLATIAELNSEDGELDPSTFAQRYIDQAHRDSFLPYLAANDVPTTVFDKDTTPIKTQLRGLRIDIENNIVVLVPPGQEDKISFDGDTADTTTKTTIRGAVKGFRGR